ncbi:hypothetical protein BH18ACI4_BH18ACI4_06630 [soil metagenome]
MDQTVNLDGIDLLLFSNNPVIPATKIWISSSGFEAEPTLIELRILGLFRILGFEVLIGKSMSRRVIEICSTSQLIPRDSFHAKVQRGQGCKEECAPNTNIDIGASQYYRFGSPKSSFSFVFVWSY